MRNEYEYTVNENNENSEVNGMNNNNGSNKKHMGAKIAASLMAMVLVSAGSIGIYRQANSSNSNTTTAVILVLE